MSLCEEASKTTVSLHWLCEGLPFGAKTVQKKILTAKSKKEDRNRKGKIEDIKVFYSVYCVYTGFEKRFLPTFQNSISKPVLKNICFVS